ncbi:MAG: hypothetical protein ACLFPM_06580 [Candidatus Izemoplasmatales bacterium]
MRKYINMTIVFLSTVLAGLLWFLGFSNLLIVAGLMVVFNIVSLIFYRETRLIIAYHVVTIFIIIGFFVSYFRLVTTEELWLLFRSFVDAGGFAIFFISFGIVLQNRTKVTLEVMLMVITVYNLIFYTSNRLTIMNYLVGFFRTTSFNSVERIIFSFNITNFIAMFIIAFIQVYLIYKLDKRLEKQEYLHHKKIQRIEDNFY